MKTNAFFRRVLVIFSFLFLTSIGSVQALQSSFDVMNFMPAADNSPYLTVYGSRTLNPREFSTSLYFDYSRDPLQCEGCPQPNVIPHLWMGNYGFAIGATDWLELGINVPFALYSRFYSDVTGLQNFEGAMGDIWFNSKVRLVDSEKHGVGLAILPFITVPTGDSNQFLGNGKVTGGAKVILDGEIGKAASLSLNVGYRARDDITRTNTRVDDELMYGFGAAMHVHPKLDVIADVSGYSVIRDLWQSVPQSPLEGEVALRYRMANGFAITGGGGGGLIDGIGAPSFRVLLGVSFTPPITKEIKPGVTAEPAKAHIEGSKIVITEIVYFDFDKATLQPRSYGVLDDVAQVIKTHPELKQVRVEGYTDSIGSDAYNLKLSNARATTVVRYLVSKGVEADRLSSKGYGESNPIASNETEEGRAKNRRTEFTILTLKP